VNSTEMHENTSSTTDQRPDRGTGRRSKRVAIGLVALGAALAVTSCNIAIDKFAREAAKEVATNVGRDVTTAAADTGRPTNDYDLLASALHRVIDLDNYEDEDYRPSHTGLSDSNRDGLDDDSKVEIRVAGARACLVLERTDADVEGGRCAG